MIETNHSGYGKLKKYYRLHAPFYDLTRWSFLFGRKVLVERIPALPESPRILEVGCGTGTNLVRLSKRYPSAQIIGIDVSDEMLERAHAKLQKKDNIRLLQLCYGKEQVPDGPFDLVIFSYSLTMLHTEIEAVLDLLASDLHKKGLVAVTDFHATPLRGFRSWMAMNHVSINRKLLPILKTRFRPIISENRTAYLGLWQYFNFIGRHHL
jgi:S-adenosylmethionine-diacylgycerolhomoserine-N-methlytransferase